MADLTTTNACISLSTGIVVPALYNAHSSSLYTVVLAHGLGSSDPRNRNHSSDKWVTLIKNAAVVDASVISYTARGHGESTGWESTAEDQPSQFTWVELGKDMNAVADFFSLGKYIAGGSSMGSATSLYAAIQNPGRISGLILIRPPTAWEVRKARRKFLLKAADRLKQELETKTVAPMEGKIDVNAVSNPGDNARSQDVQSTAACGQSVRSYHHHVLRGAADADLPAQDSELYNRIKHIPTLILTIEGDAAHPVSTAEVLHALLPSSALHVAPDIKTAAQDWPTLIGSFINKIIVSERSV